MEIQQLHLLHGNSSPSHVHAGSGIHTSSHHPGSDWMLNAMHRELSGQQDCSRSQSVVADVFGAGADGKGNVSRGGEDDQGTENES